jgi:SnoaL-like domain
MRVTEKLLVVFFVCLSTSFVIMGNSAFGADKKGRPEISAGERALAMLEVQNVFSKHAYYHQVGKFCEEMEDIWVKENGPNAATAQWTNGGQVQNFAQIKANYCTNHYESLKQILTNLSKVVPSVKDIPENIGAGNEYVMHTQETPVIEVAGDGKTAKGLWYSIGIGVRANVKTDGTYTKSTSWMWEKYAVDFIKEDGKWKIWHLVNMMDEPPLTSPVTASLTGNADGRGGPGGAPGGQGGQGGQGGTPAGQGGQGGQAPAGASVGTGAGGGQLQASKTVEVFKWSPTVVPRIDPKFPEPYYTFSETFSY